jgi:molybdopterin/thiamine biosynthesis adenylyltransferase
MSLTEQEIVRYSRHIILPEVGGRGQRKLRSASVLLVGLGASGSAAALYVAAAGVGQIALWDSELLAPHDLSAAIAHRQDRVGQPRSRSAAVALRAINPDADIQCIDRESDLLGAVPGYQVVIASTGDWPGVYGATQRAGTTVIFCASQGATGAVTCVGPNQPCLECLGEAQRQSIGLYPEGTTHSIGAAAGVIGVLAATEAIKLILSIGSPLIGRVMVYDGWEATFREIPYQLEATCVTCGEARKR